MGLKWKAFIASLESGGKIQLRVEGKFLHRKKSMSYGSCLKTLLVQ